jgi:hypothetical protein
MIYDWIVRINTALICFRTKEVSSSSGQNHLLGKGFPVDSLRKEIIDRFNLIGHVGAMEVVTHK